MSKRIFKYKIDDTIEMHQSAEILHFDFQHDKWYLWVLVDESKPVVTRKFLAVETGGALLNDELTTKAKYLGTTVTHKDSYVLHLFEEIQL